MTGHTQGCICTHCNKKWVKEIPKNYCSVNSLVKSTCDECLNKGLKNPLYDLIIKTLGEIKLK